MMKAAHLALISLGMIAAVSQAVATPRNAEPVEATTANGHTVFLHSDRSWSNTDMQVRVQPPAQPRFSAYRNHQVEVACASGGELGGYTAAVVGQQGQQVAPPQPVPGVMIEVRNLTTRVVLPMGITELSPNPATGAPRYGYPEQFLVRDSYGNALGTRSFQVVAHETQRPAPNWSFLYPREWVRYLIPLSHRPGAGSEHLRVFLPPNMFGNEDSLECLTGFW
jgi:hypothetical protein